jgi:hypothetical protein
MKRTKRIVVGLVLLLTEAVSLADAETTKVTLEFGGLSASAGTLSDALAAATKGKHQDIATLLVRAGSTYEELATNHMGQVLIATPAISDGTIIIRGLKDVFAIRQRP